jgi:DHA1 family tetracycline resistance protein-like MFS transporter
MPAPRAALALLAVAVFADSLAQSISFPLLPRLTQAVLGGDAPEAARWVGFLEVGWALPFLFAAPVLGMLSDRFGRKPLIAFSAVGIGVELVIAVYADHVAWLLLGRVLVGLSFASNLAAMAYVADVTPPERRTAAYGWINAALYAGVMAGPVLGGWLAQWGLRLPFGVAAGVAFAAAAFVLLALPESHPRSARTLLSWSGLSPWRGLSILRAPTLLTLAAVLFLAWLVFQSSDNLIVLYTAYRYDWSPLVFGLFVTYAAAAGLFVQAVLAGRLSARWGDRRLLLMGLGLQAVGLIGMGLAPNGALFVLATVPVMLGSLARPALQSLMSAQVGPDEQGRLQGAIAAVGSLASIVAPVAVTQFYAWSITGNAPPARAGLTLLVAAAIAALAATVVALRTPRA